MYLVLTAILALNVSKEILNAFVIVNEGLRSTNSNIEEGSGSLYADFEFAYSQNPAKVGENWTSAQEIRSEADALVAHITELQAYLISETEGLSMDEVLRDTTITDVDGNQITYKVLMDLAKVEMKDDMNVPTSILVGSEPNAPLEGEWSAHNLKTMIHAYRDMLLAKVKPADSAHYAAPVRHLLTMPEVVMNHGEENNWEAGLFFDTPLAAAITILSKLKADIRSTEADVVQYLYQEFDTEIIKVNHLEAAIIPESSFLLQGDTFHARVFVAASDTNKQPDMFFGQGMDPMTMAFANGSSQLDVVGGMGYVSIPTNELGEHTWDGYIDYKTDDGRVLKFPYSTTYKVSAPTATVSPTNMNVFYSGVDNPISVSAGGADPDKVSVSVSSGTVSRQGDGWVVKVTGGTSCTVTVTAETPTGEKQTMGSMVFRVKRLPKPILWYAGYNYETDRIPVATVRSNSALGAQLEEDLFKANFSVMSFTTYIDGIGFECNGSTISSQARSVLANVRPGQRVEFGNVKVRYPDNTTGRIAGLSFTVY